VMDETIAPLPTQTATVQPAHTPLKESIFTGSDVYFVLAFLVALCVIAAFIMNTARNRRTDQEKAAEAKRKEDQEDAAARTKQIMDSIDKSHGDSARDIRELTDKVKDGRTVLEKDIEAIKSVTRHDIAGVKTQIQSIQNQIDKSTDENTKLRDRMTTQETNSKHQTDALNKLEITFGKKFEEMKDLIKQQGETSTAQFKELSASLREARDVKLK
jgi:predicted  nucleic acid-binding Zn-ribbon protein